MRKPPPDVLLSIWLGFALPALFFYPLAAALEGDPYYLQWHPRHTAEALAALVVLTPLAAGATFAVRRIPGRLSSVLLLLIAGLPLASLGVGVVRQLPLRAVLIPLWEQPSIRLAAPVAAAVSVTVILMMWPNGLRRALHGLLLALSPVSLVVVWVFLTAGLDAGPAAASGPVRVNPDRPSTPSCGSVLVFLFDELSFAYLYDGAAIRPEFPHIERFSSAATHYLAASSPADDTMTALPAYLATRRPYQIQIARREVLEMTPDGRSVPFDAGAPDGLFATARRLGFSTEIAGYYFAYCDLLGRLADSCRSLSFYNRATFGGPFSVLNPVWTTLVLWPRQFPFGLAKNPPFAAQQRRLVETTLAFAARPLPGGRPVLRFVHFSVPHLPFVFDATGYAPPFDPLRTAPDDAYARQIRYVDTLVGELVAELERSSALGRATVILLSDHGYRFGGRETNPLHVPFIVKVPGQVTRADVTSPERAEELLRRVVTGACTGPA